MNCQNCNGSGQVPIQFSMLLDGICDYCQGTGIIKDVKTIREVNRQRVSLDEYKKQMKEGKVDDIRNSLFNILR